MKIDFPNSPPLDFIFESEIGLSYQWDGAKWVQVGPNAEAISPIQLNLTGDVQGTATLDYTLENVELSTTVTQGNTFQEGIVRLSDSLYSTSTTLALTANKGNELRELIDEKTGKNIEDELLIAENAQEATDLMSEAEDFSEVFNTWTRFSHLDGLRPASTSDLDSWSYDSTNDLIVSTSNTPTTIGFVSDTTYDNYNLDVVVDSTNNDDDLIGLVLAYTKDALDRENTIIVMRTPGGIGHNPTSIADGSGRRMLFFAYMNIADAQDSSFPTIDLGSTNAGLIWGDTGLVDADRVQMSDVGRWSDWNGCRIRVERRGDQFTVMTSQLGARELVPEATITFNLNDHPDLEMFKGPKAIGYTCHSQQDSFFEVLERPTDASDLVIDIGSELLWTNGGSGWSSTSLDSENNPLQPLRFYYNTVTDKLFFTDHMANANVLYS